MTSGDYTNGVIQNRRHAIIAVILTAVIAASALRSTLQPVRLNNPWLFEPLYGLPRLKPLFIGLSVFFWCFVLWIVFWFYRAARGKYERFLLGSFAVGFILSVVERFTPPQVAANMQFLGTAASLVSLAAAIMLLYTLPAKTTTPQ